MLNYIAVKNSRPLNVHYAIVSFTSYNLTKLKKYIPEIYRRNIKSKPVLLLSAGFVYYHSFIFIYEWLFSQVGYIKKTGNFYESPFWERYLYVMKLHSGINLPIFSYIAKTIF